MVSFGFLTTTVPKNKTWLSVAISDPILMRVTLSMTAAFVASQTRWPCLDLRNEGWKLKGETINSIQSILQTGSVTENLLAAIAHLTHVAVSSESSLPS
jgi:hypothetical protein